MAKADLVGIPKGRAGKSKAVDAPIVKRQKEIAKQGRPTKFTPELGDLICEYVGNGRSMRWIAKEIEIEMRTIFQWLRVHPSFQQQYARAKTEETADAMAEHIHSIAEGTLSGEYEPHAARVAIDAYKWTASKLKPKKYGDKLDLTSDGKQLPTPILGVLQAPPSIEADTNAV